MMIVDSEESTLLIKRESVKVGEQDKKICSSGCCHPVVEPCRSRMHKQGQ
ncbi:hypothetical protein GCM10020370_20470 [Paenibacillus hodogayensis]